MARLIDADELEAIYKRRLMTLEQAIQHCREKSRCNAGQCAAEHQQLAYWLEELQQLRREKYERENPRPLTLPELHGMIEQPVWVECMAMWALVNVHKNGSFSFCYSDGSSNTYEELDYFSSGPFNVYRTKPKEGQPNVSQ